VSHWHLAHLLLVWFFLRPSVFHTPYFMLS
jgi:hypothetical protein